MVAKLKPLAFRAIEGREGGSEGQGTLAVVSEGRGDISSETPGVVVEGRGGISAETLGVVPEGRGGSAIIDICNDSYTHSNVSDTYNLNLGQAVAP